MIREANGNLLKSDADAVVNTVNTVGVMGKGIALQFKRAFPQIYEAYRSACERGEVQIGSMYVWENEERSSTGPRYIINFPTKKHWRAKSKIEHIDTGLDDLAKVVLDLGVRSVAVPPLGCGQGGLPWEDVRPLIYGALQDLADVDVIVYPPNGAPKAADHPCIRNHP